MVSGIPLYVLFKWSLMEREGCGCTAWSRLKDGKGPCTYNRGLGPSFIYPHMHVVQASNSLMGESILLTMKPKAIRFKRRKPFETCTHTQHRSAGPCREGLVCCLWKLRALETISPSMRTCSITPDRVAPVPLQGGWSLGDDGLLSVCQTGVCCDRWS